MPTTEQLDSKTGDLGRKGGVCVMDATPASVGRRKKRLTHETNQPGAAFGKQLIIRLHGKDLT